MQYLTPLITKRDPIALETYAQVLFHQGQYRQAVETWEKLGNLVALEKATWPIYDAGEMDLYLEVWQFLYSQDHEPYASSLAYTLLSRGEYDQAIAILNDARTNFPQSDQFPTWGRYLGDIFKAQERFAESEQAYLDVLALDPAETKTWRNLGFLYWELQVYDKALDAFTHMSKLTPDDPYPFLLIAQTYERSGDRDKALEAYRQVLTIDPQNSEAMKAIDLFTQP
jgi:tetratricopeptide (TPR) repeat protein